MIVIISSLIGLFLLAVFHKFVILLFDNCSVQGVLFD